MFRRFLAPGLMIFFGISLQAQELSDKQRSLAGRYDQLERVLLRLAESSAHSNPRQATLLKKVLLESKDKLLVQRLETLVSALERRQFSDAVSSQSQIEQDLIILLKMLENVNRDEQREKEKEQIKEFLRDLEEILYSERALRNQTRQQEPQNLPRLEENQRNIRIRTQSLRDRIAEHEGTLPLDGPEQEQNQPQQYQSPTQRSLRNVLERMKQAEQRLKQAEKEEAIEEQEEVMAELQRLKEELEKILRQLREEELLQTLEKLEERFKRMLRQEQTIRSQTEMLVNERREESAPDQRQVKIRSDRLANEQQSVIEDAESALYLLREDGTARAMVESLLQARFDMTEVKNRLEHTVLDAATLLIEDAVIDALQEMLEAVQVAIHAARERQENQQQQQSGEAMEDEPLIQLLAELRMLRTMQRRVNERTARYDDEIKRMLENPDADLSSYKQAVEELARQQNRISRILHELRIGRGQ